MSQRALDPGNYDLAELRDVVEDDDLLAEQAAERESRAGPEPGPRTDDAVSIEIDGSGAGRESTLRRSVRRELELLDEAVDGPRTRPYLDTLPETPTLEAEVVEWLDHLATTAGRDRARDALAFYRAVGWISADVESRLAAHLEALEAPDRRETVPLGPRDHQVSLFYVSRLALVEG